MTADAASRPDNLRERAGLWPLCLLAVASWVVYGAIAAISLRFGPDPPKLTRPIPTALGLFTLAFVLYLVAIRFAVRARQSGRLLAVIFVAAIAFRGTLLPSVPIQEIDIYRYVWDGVVLKNGVSPFRFSPAQVAGAATDESHSPELAQLVAIRDGSPELAEILGRIHFARLPTIYPVVSQTVFAAAAWTTPASASVHARLCYMKVWLVAFDLTTLVLVLGLLKIAGRPFGLCVAYAWCPLLLKEVANSGHLDSIAVCLATLAVYFAAVAFFPRGNTKAIEKPREKRSTTTLAILACLTLALSVGAKVYAVILFPLMAISLAKRAGWRVAVTGSTVFCVLVVLLMWPMRPISGPGPVTVANGNELTMLGGGDMVLGGDNDVPLFPPPEFDDWQADPDRDDSPGVVTPEIDIAKVDPEHVDPSLGLVTFLSRWEMNDFIFLILVENMKPTANLKPSQTAWFSVAPEAPRVWLAKLGASRWNWNAAQTSFLFVRAVTGVSFAIIALALAARAVKTSAAQDWLEAAFLTVAWFWLLCPTQNPWYWTWALPLLPFAGSRAWLAMGGLVMIYYLRFWLTYHWPEATLLGTSYNGTGLFDFVVTWIEFGPWFVWLSWDGVRRRRRDYTSNRSEIRQTVG